MAVRVGMPDGRSGIWSSYIPMLEALDATLLCAEADRAHTVVNVVGLPVLPRIQAIAGHHLQELRGFPGSDARMTRAAGSGWVSAFSSRGD